MSIKTLCIFAGFAISASQVAAQAPAVSTIVNAASNILPGLPNAGIAQGALMVLYGTELGPGTLVSISAYPILTSLAGTSVRITTSSGPVDALVYYTSATQVAAIVPSTTPTGAASVTVTYNGNVSNAVPVTIVQNNVGLYTVNSQGFGPAVVTFTDYSYVTPSHAVNPGEYVILWADGLGPIATSDAQRPASSNMTSIPLEVMIGGKPATILYQGRNSCCASLDQINIRIPAGVAGCVTPMVLKIDNLVSNTTTIPIAATGRTCTTNDPSTTSSDFQTIIAKNKPAVGQVAILHSTSVTMATGNTTMTSASDAGSASFYQFPGMNLYDISATIDLPPPDSCALTTTGSGNALTGTTPLDAGGAITVSGPNGVTMYPEELTPGSIVYLGSFASPLIAGAYTVSGPGGSNVGSFSANLTFPEPLVWTNQSSLTTINRAGGVTVNWTGGSGASGLVQISGQSSVPTSSTASVSARFDCVANVAAGTFTVPPEVLLALPPTTTKLGTLTVGNTYNRVPFTASGLDHGFIYFGTNNLNLDIVTYQ
jgi:uncharacterized protein (TIGR03437 family)